MQDIAARACMAVLALARGLGAVFLDARHEAIPFHERERNAFHPAPSMKKLLGEHA